MNTRPHARSIHCTTILQRTTVLAALAFAGLCHAGPAEEPFYHQFISLKERSGYQPTRTFTIIIDARHDNRLVAEDDPDLQFNVMWMDQYQPGYKSRNGGAAFGMLLRNYARSLLDSYQNNQGGSGSLPGNTGDETSVGFGAETSYELRLKSDEVRVGVSYSF
ncbi:MAG: hypothetical protein RBR77_01035 [Thauera sp.]|jgi:hypothetical protein|nr:hypothetical protein [Thauera sp.]